MEAIEGLTCGDQRGHGLFDHRVDQGGLRRTGLAFGGHAARNGPRAQPSATRVAEFLIATAARGPFADNPQGAGKTGCLQPTPKFRADPAPRVPLGLECQRPSVERTLAAAERIVPLAAQNLPDRLARNAGRARQGLDRDALCGQIDDLTIERLTQLRTIPLDALGAGQGCGVNRASGRQCPT